MASEKQIQANRLNALKSTGPRTAEGKARSRLNALKHALTGEGTGLPPSETNELNTRVVAWRQKWMPVTALEHWLVDQAGLLSWRLDRCRSYQPAKVEPSAEDGSRKGTATLRGPLAARVARRSQASPHVDQHILRSVVERLSRWNALERTLKKGSHWSRNDQDRALLMLGMDPVKLLDDPDVARLTLNALVLYPPPIPPLVESLAKVRKFPRTTTADDKVRSLAALLPENADQGRASLLEVTQAEIDRLKALADTLEIRIVGSEIDQSLKGRLASGKPSERNLERYQTTCARHLERVTSLLCSLRDDPQVPSQFCAPLDESFNSD